MSVGCGQILRDTGIGFISLASGVHNQQLLTALKHVGEAAEAVGKDEIERVSLCVCMVAMSYGMCVCMCVCRPMPSVMHLKICWRITIASLQA